MKIRLRTLSTSSYITADGDIGVVKPKHRVGHWARWPKGWSVYRLGRLKEELRRQHIGKGRVRLSRVIVASFPTLAEAREYLGKRPELLWEPEE